ncbi:hypothetical protein BKA66DRAFT_283932 [Pyrenochaeta sp. MPI-SDFR-AT-0127]|nr:hypothetical protein BKA66DRAFT_283932 [Pyrenochaeta sp. MPI-SDFR-AT-0127]
MSHITGRRQSLALWPILLQLKHSTGVRRSSNREIMSPPPPNVTLSDRSSFSASSFVATLITTEACCPLGLGFPSHRIVHTSTPFSVPNRSMADQLTLPVSASITSVTSIKSALTGYHLGPTSLAPGICGSSHSAVVCQNAASLSLSTANLITLALSFTRHTRKSLTVAPASRSTPFMPCWMACLAASVVPTFSTMPPSTRLTLITNCPTFSLSVIPVLVVRESVVPDPASRPLAATDAHVCVDGGSIERVSSCARRDPIVSCSSTIWFLRYCCSD